MDQAVHHGFPVAGAQVGDRDLLPLLPGVVQEVQHRGLEAGEAEVQGRPVHVGVGELVGVLVPLLGDLVQLHPARVGDAHGPGGLVEGLPGGVVPGAAQDLQAGVVLHPDDVAVAPGDHQAQEGGCQLRAGEVVGGDVPPQMVHRDEGQPGGEGQALGEVHPHQQGPDEPRGVGDGDAVQVGEGLAALGQSLPHHPGDGLAVAAGGNLRHHAAVDLVFLHLRGDHRGEDLPPVLHHRGGGLVARAFNA